MRIRSIIALLLAFAAVFFLAACGGSANGIGSGVPSVKGASSAEELMNLCVEYLNTGDYSVIEPYHDRQAYLAYVFIDDLYDDLELTFDQAMEKAALLFGSAEALQKEDPELAALIMEETNAEDPDDFINDYLDGVREGMLNGDISPDNPNYEKLSKILADRDKGVNYILEHYPEILNRAIENGATIGLDGAMNTLHGYTVPDYEDFARFKGMECEYRPEKVYIDETGVCDLDLGTVIDDGSSWGIGMLYRV